MNELDLPRAESVDILLLLEGTFPLVHGGVASWVEQIIKSHPEYKFGVLFLGSQEKDYSGFKYEIPDNVVHLEIHYIFGEIVIPEPHRCGGDEGLYERLEHLHEFFRMPKSHSFEESMEDLDVLVDPEKGIDMDHFLYSPTAWKFTTEMYEKYSMEPSFIDYFWSVRNMHEPLWVLPKIFRNLPKAKVYHAACTGYAGLIGALLRFEQKRPLILTEHAIYTKERRLDVLQTNWIHESLHPVQKDLTEIGYLRNMWIDFFLSLARFCYGAADMIVSLYEDARYTQLDLGASPAKSKVISNGVRVKQLAKLRDQRPKKIPQVVALIGRIVPIKDVKTFIRAMEIVTSELPETEAWIVGTRVQDPDYANECEHLIDNMQLNHKVKMLGFKNIEDILPKVGVLALSSISESLPLTILESFAAGVPVVTTDVGACRQMIEGASSEDKALGKSGEIVGFANPKQLAAAIIDLLSNEDKWYAAQKAAIARVEKYYDEDDIFNKYRSIYQEAVV